MQFVSTGTMRLPDVPNVKVPPTLCLKPSKVHVVDTMGWIGIEAIDPTGKPDFIYLPPKLPIDVMAKLILTDLDKGWSLKGTTQLVLVDANVKMS